MASQLIGRDNLAYSPLLPCHKYSSELTNRTYFRLCSREGFIAPKKPYGLEAMLDDILEFAAGTLLPDGRISLWMPTANDEDVELEIPCNPHLEIVSVCVQPFNKCEFSLGKQRDEFGGES